MLRKVYESATVRRPAEAVLILAALSAGSLVAQETQERERSVAKVSFEGNRTIDDYTLGISIATTAPQGFFLLKLFGGGERSPFDEVEFRRDVLRIQLLYRRYGYFEARVDTTVRRSQGSVRVTFRIAEGPPVVVDSIAVFGVDSIIEPARLVRRLPLRVGHPFNRFRFDAAADSIVALLRNRGYPFPEIFRNYTVDRLTRLARVEYDVVPGTPAVIGAVESSGSDYVSTRTLRRAVGLREGERFSQQRLTSAQLGLYRTDLFRYANVAIASPDSLVGGVDSLVRIRVQVADAPRTRLRAGGGYGTYDCGRASAQYSRVNFLGGARRLDITSRVSKLGAASPFDVGLKNNICGALFEDDFSNRINYANEVTVTQPSLLGRPVQVGFSLFASRTSELDAYERVTAGGAVTVGFPFVRLPMSLAYRLERGRTIASAATFCVAFDQCDASTVIQLSDYRRQASLTLAMADVRTNSPIDPTAGRIFTAQFTTARPEIGSEVAFDRILAEAAVYRPLGRRWVAAARFRAGAVRAGTVTAGGSTFRFIPPSERFYAGGPTSVRGFERNAMGPIVYVADSAFGDTLRPDTLRVFGLRSSPLGSHALLLANLELRAPSPFLPARLGWALFVDAGELWEETPGNGYVPAGLRITPGVGLRIATPLGPMRFDLAYSRYSNQRGPLYTVSGTTLSRVMGAYAVPKGTGLLDRLTLHFSVGQAF